MCGSYRNFCNIVLFKEPRRVWVVGHSSVRQSAERAKKRPYGMQLEILKKVTKVGWMGRGDLRWLQQKAALARTPRPGLNIIHVQLL